LLIFVKISKIFVTLVFNMKDNVKLADP